MKDDTPEQAWVRAKALEIVDLGVGHDTNLFLNAVSIALAEIVKHSFPSRIDSVLLNVMYQVRAQAHGASQMELH